MCIKVTVYQAWRKKDRVRIRRCDNVFFIDNFMELTYN